MPCIGKLGPIFRANNEGGTTFGYIAYYCIKDLATLAKVTLWFISKKRYYIWASQRSNYDDNNPK
jgi:hypothetical protein